ncbi:MAG: HYR domain-containing protein [Saprospiraceae bacterium]
MYSKITLLFSLLTISFSQLNAQCALVCHNNITVGLDTAGQATIYAPMLMQSSTGCSNNFEISVVDTLGNQQGTLLNASLLGMPLVATLLHPASGNSCDVNITLIDALPPVLECVDTIFIWCNEILDSLEIPTVSDNATETDSLEVSFVDVFTDLVCFETVDNIEVTAYVKRTWYAEDESGNLDSCTQHIYLKRALLSQIVFPKHRNGVDSPALECGFDDPEDLSVAGQPTVEGMPVDIAGNCDLIVSHTDQEVPICGGSRKLIRTWTVFDLCTDGFLVYAQIIRMEDHTPPEVTCPDNVVFNTFSSACTAQVYLPQGTAEDACSGAIVTPTWTYGTGYGPFNNVPAGVHTVTYKAQDGCNNISTCEITVTVQDTKKPTALCELQVQVSLEDDGTALIFAATFDNGSYDNCEIGEYLVKRNNSSVFDEFVTFDCNDLNTNMQVTLTVVDVHGLENSCTSSVVVLDQIGPEILCPATTHINCGWSYTNTELTGQPYATDNCSIATVTYLDYVDLNNCGNGTVERTWSATDQDGNVSTCMQLIQISDDTDIDVVFPDNIDLYECQPNLDPSLMGEPIVTGQDCEQLQITHTDYYFYTAEPSCFQLIRNWAIVDWCSYSPNNPSAGGFWEHTQVIEVRDSVAPVLTCPADVTVGIDDNGCETFVDLPLPGVDDCSNQLVFLNNSGYAQSNQGKASGIYPKGVHTIVYTVSDGCGNTSQCTTELTVIDSEAPNPVCNNGVSVTIQQNGYVTLTPGNINNGSHDNCSPTNSLILQVSPNTFTCQDLGTKVVTLTVTDQSGNSAFCQTNVVVQDNFNLCGNGIVGVIAGKLEMENGEALSQKLVGLSGGITMAVQTDVDGTFDFPSLPLNQGYTLTPAYNTKPVNGVTTYDMVLIRRHILGVEDLPTPYKIIAADANGSKSVTTYDLVVIQKLILNVIVEFPNNVKSWRFVDANFVFTNPANPFADNFPQTINIPKLTSNMFNQNFVGIKVGDVNDSADPTDFNGGGNDDRSFDKTLVFNTEDIELVAGQVIAIPFVAATSQPMAGFQFTLNFDQNILGFQGYETGVLPALKDNNFGTVYAQDGMLTMNWENVVDFETSEGEVLFSLEFLVKNNARLSEVLALNSRLTPAEAYLGRFAEMTDLEIAGVALSFQQPTKQALQLFQNTPNPFFQTTDLHFFLPEATSVSVRIFNMHGKLIKTYTNDFSKGLHRWTLDLGNAGATGMLLCELHAEGFERKTIRMVNGK